MTRWRGLQLLVVLALLSAGSIIGMLLTDGMWDAAFFLLAALPLIIGGCRAYALRAVTSRYAKSSAEISHE